MTRAIETRLRAEFFGEVYDDVLAAYASANQQEALRVLATSPAIAIAIAFLNCQLSTILMSVFSPSLACPRLLAPSLTLSPFRAFSDPSLAFSRLPRTGPSHPSSPSL